MQMQLTVFSFMYFLTIIFYFYFVNSRRHKKTSISIVEETISSTQQSLTYNTPPASNGFTELSASVEESIIALDEIPLEILEAPPVTDRNSKQYVTEEIISIIEQQPLEEEIITLIEDSVNSSPISSNLVQNNSNDLENIITAKVELQAEGALDFLTGFLTSSTSSNETNAVEGANVETEEESITENKLTLDELTELIPTGQELEDLVANLENSEPKIVEQTLTSEEQVLLNDVLILDGFNLSDLPIVDDDDSFVNIELPSETVAESITELSLAPEYVNKVIIEETFISKKTVNKLSGGPVLPENYLLPPEPRGSSTSSRPRVLETPAAVLAARKKLDLDLIVAIVDIYSWNGVEYE